MADTPNGETATPEVLENKDTPVSTPPAVTPTDTGEAEKLRKDLEQARMREAQLANLLKAKEEAEAAARAKELAEQNQYKELFEQERDKLEALKSEQQKNEREAELKKAQDTVYSEYSEEVKALAEELGFQLLDTDETAVGQFKAKLEKLSEKVGKPAKVTPNNPNPHIPKTELTTEQLRQGLQDDNTFHEIVTKNFPGIAMMTNQRK